jgi:DNA-binding CsgD family transcriptional regulator/tetratricopeptide (TPR) repeat protein
VFVGRVDELELIADRIDRSDAGQSGVVLVCGEAGVGKTRLVDEAVRVARQRGVRVLFGHCVQLGTQGLPFAPVVEALRELVRGTGRDELEEVLGPARDLVARLIPSGRAESEDVSPLASVQVFELVLGLLERLTAHQPLLLVIEDLHWADRSTLELAAFLAQNLRGVPVTLLLTYRSDEVDRRHPLRVLLAAWERSRMVTRIELARFDRGEVRAQLAGILGQQPDPQTLDVVYERSEGNAFLVEEMLSVVRAGDAGAGLPQSLRDVLLARVDQLSEPARHVLQLAAVAGRSVPERLVVAVADLDELAVRAALRESVDAHLLVVDERDHGYSFRHALARDAVYDDLLPGERLRLHSAYAETLSRRPELLHDTTLSVAASLAHHAYAALDLPLALEASISAGREAGASLAPLEALTHYERALLIWPRVPVEQRPDDIDQAEILYRAGDAAYNAGKLDRSAALLDQALRELPSDVPVERRAEVMKRCAVAHRDLGRVALAIESFENALSLLPEEQPTLIRAELLAAIANTKMRAAMSDEGERYAQLAVAAAKQLGASKIEADALITLGYCYVHRSRPEDGVRASRAGLELAQACGDRAATVRAYIILSDIYEGFGRSAQAAEAARAGVEAARASGAFRTFGIFLLGNLTESLFHLGEWDEARRLLDDALAMHPQGVFEATIQHVRAELALRAGDFETCTRAIARAKELLVQPDDQYTDPLATIEAELFRARGDFARARATVLAALTDDISRLSQRYIWPLVWAGLRAEADLLGCDGAREAAPELHAALARLPAETAPTRGYQLWARAEAARVTGAADWAPAAEAFRALGWPWPLAYGLFRQAQAVAAAGRRDDARGILLESRQIARQLGAVPLLTAIEGFAQTARVELEQSAAASDDPLAPYGLTAREREVLLLVAAGKSNPQIAETLFISPKTASVHVSNILAKLGLSSRLEAVSLISRLGAQI